MKHNRLATIGIIVAASLFGALAASAAPITSLGAPSTDASLVTKARYYCWRDYYGYKHCGYRRGYGYGGYGGGYGYGHRRSYRY